MVDYTGKKCEELYSIINARQIAAVMMHSDLVALYAFLSLDGFTKLQCKQYKDESKTHIKLLEYCINRHNKLPAEMELKRVPILPQDWGKYTRQDVTPQARKKQVMESLTVWLEWEKETVEILSGAAKAMFEQGYIADYEFLVPYIVDTIKEVQEITDLLASLKAVDYDEIYLQDLQDKF